MEKKLKGSSGFQKTFFKFLLYFDLGLFTVALLPSCAGKLSPTSPSPQPTATPTATPNPLLIDDMEDNNNQLIVQKGRNGVWYNYVDNSAPSTIWPSSAYNSSLPFQMSSPGCPSSPNYCARVYGNCAVTLGGFAGVAFNFTSPTSVYDASAYSGFSFWAKGGAGCSVISFQVAESATYGTQWGGACTVGCYDNFQKAVTLGHAWTRYTVPYSVLAQEGWGTPAVFDSRTLITVQWESQPAIFSQVGTFDIWVDDVEFLP